MTIVKSKNEFLNVMQDLLFDGIFCHKLYNQTEEVCEYRRAFENWNDHETFDNMSCKSTICFFALSVIGDASSTVLWMSVFLDKVDKNATLFQANARGT